MRARAGAWVASGLAPVLFWPAVARAVGAWHPAWAAADVPAPLATLGPVHVLLAAAFVAAAAWLWRKAHANGLRRALTWDCGYALPTARMQYTGGSFAGIGSGWFFWILQPERAVRRPRGPFPARASRMERVPETVLEWAIEPAGHAVMRLSTAVRRLQHGRLQFYIAYVMMGLASLGLVVWWGGTS